MSNFLKKVFQTLWTPATLPVGEDFGTSEKVVAYYEEELARLHELRGRYTNHSIAWVHQLNETTQTIDAEIEKISAKLAALKGGK
jgi:hypothetical protein